jgi:hypothetical protein
MAQYASSVLTIALVAVLVVLLSLIVYGVVKGARGSDYATTAVPGETTIQLEPGTISLTYREAKNYATPTGIRSDEPPELRVE